MNGTQGGESEALLGRWRTSRGAGDEIVIATKVGARPVAPSSDFATPREGLSRAAIREASERSRERLGVARIDLYYAHIPDQTGVPLDEQVAAFGELVADGAVGLLGLSNHWAWQVERARSLAAAAGRARADVLQYHHTYLRMRTDIPDLRFSRDGEIGVADGPVLSYVRAEPGMTLVAYSPLLNGAYTRPRKEAGPRLRPSGHQGQTPGAGPGGAGDGRDGESGGARVADRRGTPDRAAHRRVLRRAARREPGRGRPGAQRGTAAAS